MVFSSYIFISLFLPLVLTAYYLFPRGWRNAVLLTASFFFYAWGDSNVLWVMAGEIVLACFGARILDMYSGVGRRAVTGLFIVLLLLPLFYFKYSEFLLSNVAGAFGADYALRRVALPLGISFYTFQALSYLVDVCRREVPVHRRLTDFALYISFFPQLVAGPILKYHEVRVQIERRTETMEKIAYGTRRFCIGFSKKVIVANAMGHVADLVFNSPVDSFGPFVAWSGAIAYALQIYYDFSGYSDMAIGLGALFGFHFSENFRWPYASLTITEFWRRWHISLSTWFREYVYIPLGGNRKTFVRTFLNLGVVFAITGVWHGAAWTFVIWGVWHGAFVLLEKAIERMPSTRWILSYPLYRIVTLLVVLLGWVLFRGETLGYVGRYFLNMFGLLPTSPLYTIGYFVSGWSLGIGLLSVVGSLGVLKGIASHRDAQPGLNILKDVYVFSSFLLSLIFLAGATYNPFIYFRF